MIKIFQPANPEERRRYYREEWKVNQIPNFIREEIENREFGFDQVGKGPTDRYRVFRTSKLLQRFMMYRAPFAAYCSVAFYKKPRRRDGWIKSELVFDVDAKDLPIRSCSCEGVCEICLEEAKEVVMCLVDTLRGDMGFKNIHVVYSGRGYHIRTLDDFVMKMDSDVRSQVLKYIVGADIPESKYEYAGVTYNLEHFSIPFGYPKVFTERVKYTILHLTRDAEIENVDQRLLQDIIKNRNLIQDGEWGEFRSKIGRIRYKRFANGASKLNLGLVDAKVTIDLKRILRLPSSLHSMVSMKCMEVEDLENFDPFREAVPKFVYERV